MSQVNKLVNILIREAQSVSPAPPFGEQTNASSSLHLGRHPPYYSIMHFHYCSVSRVERKLRGQPISFLIVILLSFKHGEWSDEVRLFLFGVLRRDEPFLDEYIAGLCILLMKGGMPALYGAVLLIDLQKFNPGVLVFLFANDEAFLVVELAGTVLGVVECELLDWALAPSLLLNAQLRSQVFIGRDAGGL